VHPRVLEALVAGEADVLERLATSKQPRREGLDTSERRLLAFLGEAA